VGGGQSLGIRILVEFRNPAVANTEGHHASVIERANCILDSAAGPTDHEDAVGLRYKFAWFEGDSHVRVEILKEISHAAPALVGSGVVVYCARQMPYHVFGNDSLIFFCASGDFLFVTRTDGFGQERLNVPPVCHPIPPYSTPGLKVVVFAGESASPLGR
jgi:hypothetical protein